MNDPTMVKSGTRRAAAAGAAAAAVAGMAGAAAPAHAAAYPVSTFTIPYGASYFNGTVTWYNRSVGIDGAFKAGNCRRAYGEARTAGTSLSGGSTSTWCNKSGPVTMGLDANVTGGATVTWVYLTDELGNYLHGQTCYRGVGKCVDGLHQAALA
jgi:hypothetical protein